VKYKDGGPSNYVTVRKRSATIPTASAWLWPRVKTDEYGVTWFEDIDPLMAQWAHLGWAPRPITRGERWAHHWHLGRLSGYPRLAVFAFCVRRLWSSRGRGR
jgi:hypothetical protein